MSKPNHSFQVGSVNLIPMLGDITQLEVDALIPPAGTSSYENLFIYQASPWVRNIDRDGLIEQALITHAPLELGRVIVTPAYHLSAKYLFHAIVVDWADTNSPRKLVKPEIVESAARICIELAAALGLKSIAFTPWGTRVERQSAAQVTAVMLQAITAQLHQTSGVLESIYLISNNPEHYQWFVDRTFVFHLLSEQVNEIQDSISELDIPEPSRKHLSELLNNLQDNVVVYNEIVGGDKITIGDITDADGIAVGREAEAHIDDQS